MGKSFRFDRDDYEEVEYNRKREKSRRNNRRVKHKQQTEFIDYVSEDIKDKKFSEDYN